MPDLHVVHAPDAAPTVAVEKPAAAEPTPATTPPPAAETPAPPPPKTIGLEDLSALVTQLSARYERGDLEGFLALFDEAARIETGDKARIRSDYDELFRTTDMRQLRISDMKWVTDGALLRGKGNFQGKVVRKGEDVVRSYTGTIRLDAVPAGGTVRLRGMLH
jgi:hypothetical protein